MKQLALGCAVTLVVMLDGLDASPAATSLGSWPLLLWRRGGDRLYKMVAASNEVALRVRSSGGRRLVLAVRECVVELLVMKAFRCALYLRAAK